MSTAGNLPLWVRDREEVLKNDDGVEWRGGKRPNYSMTDARREQEKKCC